MLELRGDKCVLPTQCPNGTCQLPAVVGPCEYVRQFACVLACICICIYSNICKGGHSGS